MEYCGMLGPVSGCGIKRLPICFTGVDARTMVRYIVVAGVFIGGSVGILIGVLISAIWGLEGVPYLIAAVAGVIGGVGIVLYVSIDALGGGTCTCPPGSFGFCINVIYMKIPGIVRLLPWPPFIEAARAQCGRLVPPGCR